MPEEIKNSTNPVSDTCKNHIVAHGYEDFYGGYIADNELLETALSIHDEQEYWYNQKGGASFIKAKMDTWRTLHEFVEGKIKLFNYCPECGIKLEHVLKNIKCSIKEGVDLKKCPS